MVLALQFYKSLVQWLLKCNFVNHLCRGLLTNLKQTAEIRLIYFLKKLQPWLQMEEVEREEICSEIIRPDKLMAFDESKTFDEISKFCGSVGGQFAVASDNSSFLEIMEIFNQTCELDFFYSGYTDREQHGRWRDVNSGQDMSWDNWLESYPTSYTSDDCTYGDLTDGQVYNADCLSKTCPVCKLESLKRFKLRGGCLDSAVEQYYVMRSNKEFLGLIQTSIIFSSEKSRWEIVNTSDPTNILAYMEAEVPSFPLGRQPWHFLDVNCSDPGPNGLAATRTLNFHLEVEQPGHFCCDDGACVDSELVCNNFPDCEDRSDERDCDIILFPDYKYSKHYPPVQSKNGESQPLKLYANLSVLDIFEINEVDSSFDFYFMIMVQWFDKNLKFEFLKKNKEENSIPGRYQNEGRTHSRKMLKHRNATNK